MLFANEHEICTLYEVDDFDDALQQVLHHCEIAALTRGAKGSVVVSGDDVHVIDAAPGRRRGRRHDRCRRPLRRRASSTGSPTATTSAAAVGSALSPRPR